MRRRLLCLLLVLGPLVALPGVPSFAGPSTVALGPEVVAWWSRAELGLGAPTLLPPGVGEQDLYVAGSTATSPVTAAVPAALPVDLGPVAISGLSFRLPPGAAVTELRLRRVGQGSAVVTLTACRALAPFGAVQAGPWTSVPAYDCTDAATARTTDDGSVLLDGVDRLRRGRDLQLVLVPGPLDSTVLARPDASALQVSLAPSSAPAAPSAAGAPAEPAGPAGRLTPAPAASPPVFVAPGPAAAPLLGPTGPPPAVAAPSPAPVAAATALPAKPWPALLSILALALLAFVLLVRPCKQDEPGARGVGRFRTERVGRVPDLT